MSFLINCYEINSVQKALESNFVVEKTANQSLIKLHYFNFNTVMFYSLKLELFSDNLLNKIEFIQT
jgi:hypothetical protein